MESYDSVNEDIRQAAEKLQKVLAFYEQRQSHIYPLVSANAQEPGLKKSNGFNDKEARLEDELRQMKEQLKLTIAEKNMFMKQCQQLMEEKETSVVETSSSPPPPPAVVRSRRRSNSELQLIADTIAQPGAGGIESDTSSTHSSDNLFLGGKSSFRLLQCSDEQCEVFKPRNNQIRTTHHARNNVQFMWDQSPQTVLIVKKPNEPSVSDALIRIGAWLAKEKGMTVYVEPVVHQELKLSPYVYDTWDGPNWRVVQKEIDFIVSLGGDGTVLWVSSMFKSCVPPVISFAMGSLGFLTPFDFVNNQNNINQVINGGFFLSLRSRLKCTIVRKNQKAHKGDETSLYDSFACLENYIDSKSDDSESDENLGNSVEYQSYNVLNEVVIDRGPSAALVELDCFCDSVQFTKVAADGIIIGTPTGSTAYSLSAGGSMVHPSVPSMLFTPICPHSLSFRPVLFHDSATIQINVPLSSRSSAFVSFDGKNRVELNRGDSLFVKVSSFPLPAVCKLNENKDWFMSIQKNLNWNQRKEQKPLHNSSI